MCLCHSIKMIWDKTKINIDINILLSMRFLINFNKKIIKLFIKLVKFSFYSQNVLSVHMG